MKKYIGICYDGETSSPIEVETLIPYEIVERIEIALNGLDNNNWQVSSGMIDTQDLTVMFEVTEKTPIGHGLRYQIKLIEEQFHKIKTTI
jgi:hypothetical protein